MLGSSLAVPCNGAASQLAPSTRILQNHVLVLRYSCTAAPSSPHPCIKTSENQRQRAAVAAVSTLCAEPAVVSLDRRFAEVTLGSSRAAMLNLNSVEATIVLLQLDEMTLLHQDHLAQPIVQHPLQQCKLGRSRAGRDLHWSPSSSPICFILKGHLVQTGRARC